MKLFLGICNTQHEVPAEFFWSFIAIRNEYETVPFRSRHPWDIVRNNKIVYEFLKSDCDVLVKMDIDQSYPSNYFEKLVHLVEKYKVIGPLIHDRGTGHTPLMFSERNGFMMTKMDLLGKTGIEEVPYCHTNLFYAREVLEKIPAPWYEASLSQDGLERGSHVDYDFLDKIHNAGYPTYIDISTVVGHQTVGYEWGDEYKKRLRGAF
jgi:hypothetical protein